jgi:hypothetical protein
MFLPIEPVPLHIPVGMKKYHCDVAVVNPTVGYECRSFG